ncbi:hypothetical protein Q3G72_034565 [Acer saccharum]|nr:hypothetical protein Q3G72_034565 [Acer saccharum]
MTILKFLHPMDLFDRLHRLRKKSIGVDFGEWSTGLCLCEAPTCNPKIYPILAPENWEGKYALSPLDHILNQGNKGGGHFQQGWFFPSLPFSPQLLNGTTIAVSEIRDVLNYLTAEENVEYFIFRFNVDSRYWDDKENYSFIRKQLQDFEDDGKIETIYFTFADESNSTDVTQDFFDKKFPELEDKELFLAKHHLFKEKILDNLRYQDQNGKNLKKDLSKYHKRMLDCYVACSFCWEFLTKCASGQLMDGFDNLIQLFMMPVCVIKLCVT